MERKPVYTCGAWNGAMNKYYLYREINDHSPFELPQVTLQFSFAPARYNTKRYYKCVYVQSLLAFIFLQSVQQQLCMDVVL